MLDLHSLDPLGTEGLGELVSIRSGRFGARDSDPLGRFTSYPDPLRHDRDQDNSSGGRPTIPIPRLSTFHALAGPPELYWTSVEGWYPELAEPTTGIVRSGRSPLILLKRRVLRTSLHLGDGRSPAAES